MKKGNRQKCRPKDKEVRARGQHGVCMRSKVRELWRRRRRRKEEVEEEEARLQMICPVITKRGVKGKRDDTLFGLVVCL